MSIPQKNSQGPLEGRRGDNEGPLEGRRGDNEGPLEGRRGENKGAPSSLELEILEMWKEVLGASDVGLHEDFMARGGTPEIGSQLVARFEQRFGGYWHLPMIVAAPTVAAQAAYLERYYLGRAQEAPDATLANPTLWRNPNPELLEPHVAEKNPSAVFILTAGRSGSTLFRGMLAGHPQLFAPPELDLLCCKTVRERSEATMSGWSDPGGLNLAVRDLWNVDKAGAAEIIADWVARDLSTREAYALLQQKAGARLLAEKCISYPLSVSCLSRAEAWFDQPRYIHLVRHPLAMMRSWKGFHLDHIFEQGDAEVTDRCRDLPEMTWLRTNENILEFLASVPAKRHCRLAFEDLVSEPEAQMSRISAFLGIELVASMLTPYEGKRMTENVPGLTAGDRAFYSYQGVEPSLASKSRRKAGDRQLHPQTIAMAERLGYNDL
jgi:hypothetical protein